MDRTQLDQVLDTWGSQVEIHEGPTRFLADFERVPAKLRPIIAGAWCDYEVCNGGLRQFFENSTGVLAPEASAAFESLHLSTLATVVREGIALFGEPYPRDRKTRMRLLNSEAGVAIRSSLELLDTQFFAARTGPGRFDSRWETAAAMWLAPAR